MAQRDPVPMTSWAAPLEDEVGAFAAPEVALRVDDEVTDAAEFALEVADEAEAGADEAEDVEAEEEDMDMEFDPLPVIDIAPDPVNVPSPILLVVTTAVLESELLYHGWLNASGIAIMFHPFCRPTGKAAMNASTSVSLISCSKELIPGDLDPSNQPVMAARTDS